MSNAVLCASLWPDYNLRHPLYGSGTLGLFCVARALRRCNQKERKEPVSRGQKAFLSDKKLCQHFLPGSKRPAFRAVSLLLRGEPEFNGASLPLHLPACVLLVTAVYMWASECRSVWEPNSPNTICLFACLLKTNEEKNKHDKQKSNDKCKV